MNHSNHYPALPGIDWAFENMGIINLKKRYMIFEGNNMKLIVPLDPSEGVRYTSQSKKNTT